MQTEIHLKKQRGLSAPQIVIGLAALGLILHIVLKIMPVYMHDKVVQNGLKSLSEEQDLNEMGKREIRSKLLKHFDLNGVRNNSVKNIKVRRRSEGWLVNIDYEERIPFFANIDIVLSFENQFNAAAPEDCCKKIISDAEAE